MIEVEKVYSDNPFVDETIYYCKLIALNCAIKDEEEALSCETKVSLARGDTYIACIENRANYEMFENYPKEILEQYIENKSNLDVMVDNPYNLQLHLNSFSVYKRNEILDNLSKLARTVYLDHDNIINNYMSMIGPTWIEDNKPIYDACTDKTATYKELFNLLPSVTRKRILKQYITNYDNTSLDTINASIESFQSYIDHRSDTINITNEIKKIDSAMIACFKSHYEIVKDREYLSNTTKNYLDYYCDKNAYNKAVSKEYTYKELFRYFPAEDLKSILSDIFTEEIVIQNNLHIALENLVLYIQSLHDSQIEFTLNETMRKRYIECCNMSTNRAIIQGCSFGNFSYFDLVDYIPKETLKLILNTEFSEVSNLEVYSDNKKMLNSYLNTLQPEEASRIKNGLTSAMQTYYVTHYVELNNYYRIVLGMPPLGDNGVEYEDTLLSTYDASSQSNISFGTTFIDMIPEGIYPEIHWTRTPIYKFDAYDISILTEYGIIDAYLEKCSKADPNRYKYFQYLGDNALDIYTCRKASNFQLISVPIVDNTEIKNKFVDKFALNRDYTIRTIYSDAYKFQSEYYNKFIIIFILMNTIMDVLADIPTMITRREIFDSRSIKYLFESYGIPYYSEIPVKFQQAMLKNLNTLIKYKSSTKNMVDICSLFGFDDVRVFGYYMLKQRVVDRNTGEYVFSKNNDISYALSNLYVLDPTGTEKDLHGVRYTKMLSYRNYREDKYTKRILVKSDAGSITEKLIVNNEIDCYVKDTKNNIFIPLKSTDYFNKIKTNINAVDLKFIKVPINETLTDYKNDDDYIINYDEIVSEDDTWNGGLQDEYIRNKIIDYEFNTVKTKYISVETVTEMTELAFQVSYFYNMLFDNLYSEESLTLEIPYIKSGHKFKFMDIVCYLFSLMYIYNGIQDNIMYSPTQILYVKGYNFDESVNAVLRDDKIFTQTKNPMDQENIFDINDRIAEDHYDYQAAFDDKKIKGFNLQADIDEIDKWLAQYQMSLDDFIVDSSLTTFDHIITLRDFYTLNNSYYQKNIFKNALLPTPYNQNIKYGFNCDLIKKIYINDINGVKHEYISEPNMNGYDLLINNNSDSVYIFNNDEYIIKNQKDSYVIYCKYNKSESDYLLDSVDYYIRDLDGNFVLLFDDGVYVKDKSGRYILSAEVYYTKGTNNKYYEITKSNYFSIDLNKKKIINIGEYYILKDGKYVLDPDNCYIIVQQNGVNQYVLAKDVDGYVNEDVLISSLYVLHSDGHFIPLLETDFYVKNEDGTYTYNEEDCYIKTDDVTIYFDPAYPGVYYKKLTDYKSETDYVVISDQYYVKDPDGNFIQEKNILSPNNCYIKDKVSGQYVLVIDSCVKYYEYIVNKISRNYVLILQPNNDYNRYILDYKGNYIASQKDTIRYIRNSQIDYIILLYTDATYDDTKKIIVILNKDIDGNHEDETTGFYDPEDDGVWDENDWFYTDPDSIDKDNAFGMNGENKWYYRKPGSSTGPNTEEQTLDSEVASGFYFSADTYMGSNSLVPGEKYYIALDIETNFTNTVQIGCESDSELLESTSRNYTVTSGELLHITQVFTCSNVTHPKLIFYIYNYNETAIKNGDYFIISNIRLVKAYNDNYIPQDIPSYDKLQEIYRTNEAIYKYLVTKMEECSDLHTYNIYKYLYDALMTSKYNKEAFKLDDGTYAKTYTDFLQTRDSVLYERLTYLKSIDTQTMQKEIADSIIEVTYAIDSYVDTYNYGYLYSYFPAVSATYIQQYISKIINFFKSWKVHLLGINTLYKFDDGLNNLVKILEDQEYRMRLDRQISHVYINDSIKINPFDDKDSSGNSYIDKYPDLITTTNLLSNEVKINDRVKLISRTANYIEYKDNEMHLILNNDDVEAYVDENGDLIVSNDSGLTVEIPNDLLYDTDEEDIDCFASHKINEINKDVTIIQ